VIKVFVDNPFPIPVVRHTAGIRCLDISAARTRLALVDEAARLFVYDLESKVEGGPEVGAGVEGEGWGVARSEALAFSRCRPFPLTCRSPPGPSRRGQAVTFEAESANSVAWNADCDDMLCFSGGGALTIKTGDFPPHSQRMSGFVVGFRVRPLE
jgi:intraflagellar transport protein 122